MAKPEDPRDFPIKWSMARKEALKRHPLYRQEFETAFQSFCANLPEIRATASYGDLKESFQQSPQGRKLNQRWGLRNYALHPDDELWDMFQDELTPIFFADQGNAVETIPFGKVNILPTAREKSLSQTLVDQTLHLRDGRYLLLEIDLIKSKGQIESEIGQLITMYQRWVDQKKKQQEPRPNLPLPDSSFPTEEWIEKRNEQIKQAEEVKPRSRGKSLDIYLDETPPNGPVTIFQVWDMNKEEGKSPWKIALELYPFLRGKTYRDHMDNYDSNAKRLKKQIIDAIDRVDRIITSLNPAS
jgi:hypothetical protein